ncbi:MAG: DUF47 family protein [Phycisphaerae bacterium]|nr:DUF47 family protein [Phycisphaerae bacterium]
MIFASKQKKIEALFEKYCDTIAQCLKIFEKSYRTHCENGDIETTRANYANLHRSESLADDIIEEIEVMMFSKSLFPESRSDILKLVELMDKVPNAAEQAVLQLVSHRILIPTEYATEILRLVEVSHRCVIAMLGSARKLFTDYTNATVAIGKVDELETEADGIEGGIVERIFLSDMDGFEKIILRDLIRTLGGICDRAENAADHILIMVAKRKV